MKKLSKDFSILIVDDDHDLCLLLKTILKRYAVHIEHSLSSAMSFIERHHVSLLLLDNSLPDGMGIEFIKEASREQRDIKIVLMTADASIDLAEKAIREGAFVFINKPFKLVTLEKIADVIFTRSFAA